MTEDAHQPPLSRTPFRPPRAEQLPLAAIGAAGGATAAQVTIRARVAERVGGLLGPRASWRSWPGAVAIASIAYAAVVVAAFVARPAGEAGAQLISDFSETPIEVLGLLLAIAVVATEQRAQARIAWSLIALAVAANGIGNVIYGAHDIAGGTPFPSLADAFYLAFYPLLLFGLLFLPTASRRRDILDWRTASNVAIVIIGGGMAVLHFMLAPLIPGLGTGDPLTSAILLAYPIGDLALLAALATMSARRPYAVDQQSITLFAGVVGLWLVADILYAVITAAGASSSGAVTDLLYLGGDLVIVLAARANLAQRRSRDVGTAVPSPEATRLGPYLVLLMGLVTLVTAALSTYPEMAILAVMAVCLTSLVVARQLVDERLRRRTDALLLEAHRMAAAEAEARARRDPLTGLANRVALGELLLAELAVSAETGAPVTIAFADLNGFKSVNDTLGHAAGDDLLVAVGGRLVRAVRSSDVVVRLGGDEFAIVLAGVEGAQALEIVRRAATTLEAPFSVEGTAVSASGAFGLATSRGVGVGDLDALLTRADTAMYRAKRLRLGPVWFDPAVDQTPGPTAIAAAPLGA